MGGLNQWELDELKRDKKQIGRICRGHLKGKIIETMGFKPPAKPGEKKKKSKSFLSKIPLIGGALEGGKNMVGGAFSKIKGMLR